MHFYAIVSYLLQVRQIVYSRSKLDFGRSKTNLVNMHSGIATFGESLAHRKFWDRNLLNFLSNLGKSGTFK